jgi:hypothetical protein
MAKIAVRSFMETDLISQKKKYDNSDVVFIVGKGKRSEDKPVLLPAIMHLFEEEYGITAVLDENNTGRIRISSDCISSLVERKKWNG